MIEARTIILCGPTGSGKTSFAAELGRAGYQPVSCSAIVRRLAAIPPSSSRLDALAAGQRLLRREGHLWFALKVVASFRRRVVIDGPRPIAVAAFLARLCEKAVVVYLDASPRELRRRKLHRAKADGQSPILRSPFEKRSDRFSDAVDLVLASRPINSRGSAVRMEAVGSRVRECGVTSAAFQRGDTAGAAKHF